MKTLDDESFDVCVTSPPYNLGKFQKTPEGKRMTTQPYATYHDDEPEPEYQEWQVGVLNELWRVCKSVAFYNHKIRIRDNRSIHPMEWLPLYKWTILQEVVLDFGATGLTDNRRFYPVTERIWVLGKTGTEKLDNVEHYTDVWKMPKVARAISGHPATFHERLPERCLRSVPWAKRVIDPFSGTGTVCNVAARMGIESLGIEISEKYIEISKERSKQIQPALL